MKILIIEDEIFAALHLEEVVRQLGCSVVGIAADAEAALRLAEKEPADLALVDINLRDGPTGPRLARDIATRYGTKVIFVTGNPEQAPMDIEGVLGVVPKPVNELAIASIIERARTIQP